ncbi:hypothetical protein Tco_0291431 [Tanacetum coccineum]
MVLYFLNLCQFEMRKQDYKRQLEFLLQELHSIRKATKFKKPPSPQLTTVPVSIEVPTRKSKRVKRPEKKSTKAPERGVVIRETPKMPLSKKKEKVDVTRGKGIELLYQVALTEDAQYEEVQRKSMRDFHRSSSGVSDVTKEESSESEAESLGNDEDDSNNDQDSSGEDNDQENDSIDDKIQSDNDNESNSEYETNENELGSESDQEKTKEDEDDEEEVKDELVKTPSNDSDDEDETKITNKEEGDEDEEMDYTTSQLYDDVDKRLNETVDTDKGIQKDKDKDEDPSAGSDRGLKKRKTSKDATPVTCLKAKESQSGLSKGDKSQSKSSGKSVQSEEPKFEVVDSDMPQVQEEFHSNSSRGMGYLKGDCSKKGRYRTLYRLKEGDFHVCYLNDIEDMLLLVVQNRLTNLSGDDFSNFAIALRMFTRSLVKREACEDLQLESKVTVEDQ